MHVCNSNRLPNHLAINSSQCISLLNIPVNECPAVIVNMDGMVERAKYLPQEIQFYQHVGFHLYQTC